MIDIIQIEPFKTEYFEKFFRLNDNCFLIMSDYDFYYKDLKFEKPEESIFFVSFVNDIYIIKLFREIDQKIILEAELKKENNEVRLINIKLETAFKYENKEELNESNIKKLILFCLVFANGKVRDLHFDYFGETSKIKFAEVFKKLQIIY